jgi:hypothetical protein
MKDWDSTPASPVLLFAFSMSAMLCDHGDVGDLFSVFNPSSQILIRGYPR